MSNDDLPPPILVNESPGRDQVATAIRYVLMAASSVATALGAIEVAGKFNALLITAGPIATAMVFVWGQVSARRAAQTKAALASRLPDDVATFK